MGCSHASPRRNVPSIAISPGGAASQRLRGDLCFVTLAMCRAPALGRTSGERAHPTATARAGATPVSAHTEGRSALIELPVHRRSLGSAPSANCSELRPILRALATFLFAVMLPLRLTCAEELVIRDRLGHRIGTIQPVPATA